MKLFNTGNVREISEQQRRLDNGEIETIYQFENGIRVTCICNEPSDEALHRASAIIEDIVLKQSPLV